MSRQRRWTQGTFDRGFQEIRLSAWKWFSDYVHQQLLDYTTYIYRGHANCEWGLKPTLDRIITRPQSFKRSRHLKRFKFATRGRRGSNPPMIEDENGWWALGQHHGLATPLLDWTESPFVALYFAMMKARGGSNSHCCVWALSEDAAVDYSERIKLNDSIAPVSGRKPIVEIVRPLSDENNRLVNQRGLFTRGPNNVNLQEWVQTYHPDKDDTLDLIKLVIPRTDVDDCLRYLNRMNINHATLFPDVYGASEFCNMNLQIRKY